MRVALALFLAVVCWGCTPRRPSPVDAGVPPTQPGPMCEALPPGPEFPLPDPRPEVYRFDLDPRQTIKTACVALVSPLSRVLCSGVLVSPNHVLTAAHCEGLTHMTRRFPFADNGQRVKIVGWSAPYGELTIATLETSQPGPVNTLAPRGAESFAYCGFGPHGSNALGRQDVQVCRGARLPCCHTAPDCADSREFVIACQARKSNPCASDSGGGLFTARGELMGVVSRVCGAHGACPNDAVVFAAVDTDAFKQWMTEVINGSLGALRRLP